MPKVRPEPPQNPSHIPGAAFTIAPSLSPPLQANRSDLHLRPLCPSLLSLPLTCPTLPATSEATGVDAAEDVARITQPNKAHEQRHRKLQTTADSTFCRTVYLKGATWCPSRFKGNALAIATGFLKARSLLSLALSAQPGNAAALGNAAEVEEALGNAAAAHELFVRAHRAGRMVARRRRGMFESAKEGRREEQEGGAWRWVVGKMKEQQVKRRVGGR
ncbi:unnamed protein product [Closterium sp. NIES-64]|nr:unnamed protein product [Closterium sp. NIES-64]